MSEGYRTQKQKVWNLCFTDEGASDVQKRNSEIVIITQRSKADSVTRCSLKLDLCNCKMYEAHIRMQ